MMDVKDTLSLVGFLCLLVGLLSLVIAVELGSVLWFVNCLLSLGIFSYLHTIDDYEVRREKF